MIIQKAKRSNTSFCRVCGKVYKRGDSYLKLDGSFRVMRSKMCIDHFNIRNCSECKESERMKCITTDGKCMCILGGEKTIKILEAL